MKLNYIEKAALSTLKVKNNFIYIILNGEIESFLEKNKTLNSNLILKKGSSLGLMDFILNRNYSKTMLAKKPQF